MNQNNYLGMISNEAMPCFHTLLAVFVVAPALAFKAVSDNAATINHLCIPDGGHLGTDLCIQSTLQKNMTQCLDNINCDWEINQAYCRPNHRCFHLSYKADCEMAAGGHCTWWSPGPHAAVQSLYSNDSVCIPHPVPQCHAFNTTPDCEQYGGDNCAWDHFDPFCRPNSRCTNQLTEAACASKTDCLWWDAMLEPR